MGKKTSLLCSPNIRVSHAVTNTIYSSEGEVGTEELGAVSFDLFMGHSESLISPV